MIERTVKILGKGYTPKFKCQEAMPDGSYLGFIPKDSPVVLAENKTIGELLYTKGELPEGYEIRRNGSKIFHHRKGEDSGYLGLPRKWIEENGEPDYIWARFTTEGIHIKAYTGGTEWEKNS
jgi:hypothetical protein